jgi:hypothetical protein
MDAAESCRSCAIFLQVCSWIQIHSQIARGLVWILRSFNSSKGRLHFYVVPVLMDTGMARDSRGKKHERCNAKNPEKNHCADRDQNDFKRAAALSRSRGSEGRL